MKQYLESSLPNFKSTKPVNEAENDPNNDAEQVEMFGKLCEPLLDVENSQNQLTVFSKLVTYSVVVFTIITVHLMIVQKNYNINCPCSTINWLHLTVSFHEVHSSQQLS